MNYLFSSILLVICSHLVSAQELKVGDMAPDFSLKSTNEKTTSLNQYAHKKGVIIIFTCNHCPYAKAYEDRIVAIQKKYGSDFQVIAINPNDATEYPEDGFEEMKKRATEKNFNFPYLHDETQTVAKAYGAKKTPHVYLLKKTEKGFEVAYIGAIDDNYTDVEKAKKKYLENAIAAILSKKDDINPNTTAAVGCSIKWKK